MDEPVIKVNSAEYIDKLNKLLPAVRNKVAAEALMAGALEINIASFNALLMGIKDRNRISHLRGVFQTMRARPKDENVVMVKTGVSSRKHGYKLRWLEWGTKERFTHKRYSSRTGQIIEPVSRGKIQRIGGKGFFYPSISRVQQRVFDVISDRIIQSLERVSK